MNINEIKAKRDRLRTESAQVNQNALNAIASTDAVLAATAGLADNLRAIAQDLEREDQREGQEEG